jgi:hypothetical protein
VDVEDAWACPCESLVDYCPTCPHCPEYPEECVAEQGDPHYITQDAIEAMNEAMRDPNLPTRKLPPR